MNEASSANAPSPLLFHWEAARQRKVAITLFFIASVMAHIVCFYIFQVVYPPPVALLPAPARVNLITAHTEEGRTLLRWIEAEDPALAFMPQRPAEARSRSLSKTTHIPSYLTHEPALMTLPPLEIDVRAPSPQPPGAVPIFHRPPAPIIGPIPTTVSFSEELREQGTPVLDQFKFRASTNEPPQNARFRIALGRTGEVRYCFPINSSGDRDLDEQARTYLMRCRFRPADDQQSGFPDQPVWGTATIEWGNDLALPAATSKSSLPQ